MKKLALFLFCFTLVWNFCGCESYNKSEAETIRIAAKDFTEQYILGEILARMVEEHTDLKAKLTDGIAGETSIIMPAMEKGDFDIYPEYDSTAWMTVLKQSKTHDTEEMHRQLQQIYNDEYDMSWIGFYGFDNTYGITVRKDTAEQYGLETYSDLAAISDELIFGAGYEFFEREDGYTDLQKLYHFRFKEIKEMNLNLKYNALLDGQVDAITIYRTDGRMKNEALKELTDDLNYFPPAMGGTIIRNEIAKAHPELVEALQLLNGAISNEDMRRMNAAVDQNGEEPYDVAEAFLKEKGLIP